jgi:hypothetical protein
VKLKFLIIFGIILLSYQAKLWGQQSGNQPPPSEEETQTPQRGLLDDSTKMVYGPRTTLYYQEKLLRYNKFEQIQIDTSLNNFHNYEPVANSGYRYQDLGNLGSAAKPIFYEVPGQIGRTSGFHVYDLYYHSPDSMRYYNSKSPHTNLSAFFGGGNRNSLDISFTRNITPKWNVGFDFKTIRARKVLNPTRRDDNMVVQNYYALHTNYQSEDEKYFLLANFSRMKHLVNEQGGIIPPEVDTTSLYFTYEDSKVWLRNSRAVDLRQDYHVYHQYEIVKGWQVYHVFDKKKQLVTFFSDLSTSDALFFNEKRFNSSDTTNVFAQTDTTNNHNHFSEWRNELGFKGDFGPVYYNAYVKFRSGRMASNFFKSNNSFNEVYLGGALRGEINEEWSFEAEGEYLIPDGYRFKGLFVSPFLEVSYIKALYKPSLAQEQYRGNHYRWTNNFSNIGVDQIKGEIKADFKGFSFRPSLVVNRINNYIYYGLDTVPGQSEGQAFMVIPGFKSHFTFSGKFHWQTEAHYTVITGNAADNFRIPDIFLNSRIYFDGPLFNENIFVQIGLEGRYRSDYYADAYMPATQQFYLQNEFNIYAYPVLDAFINFRINRTRVMFRYNHLNSNLLDRPGYFVTPGYTGLNSMLDLGINWSFFD